MVLHPMITEMGGVASLCISDFEVRQGCCHSLQTVSTTPCTRCTFVLKGVELCIISLSQLMVLYHIVMINVDSLCLFVSPSGSSGSDHIYPSQPYSWNEIKCKER